MIAIVGTVSNGGNHVAQHSAHITAEEVVRSTISPTALAVVKWKSMCCKARQTGRPIERDCFERKYER